MAEDQNIEYKESWRDEYLKWICGFANAQGGKIFIGINDNGDVTGVDDYKKLLEDIPNKSISHLGLMLDVNHLTKNKKHFIEISVQPSSVPISYAGRYYYRSGSTKQELKGNALHQFLMKKIGMSWEQRPIPEATIKDIDESAIRNFIQKAYTNHRIADNASQTDTITFLKNLDLINDNGELLLAALLLFGQKPTRYSQSAYFKIGRFGKSEADLLFQDIVEGNILEMADKVMAILEGKYLTRPISYKGLLRIEPLEYPEPALREAILNAIIHKDYSETTIFLSIYDHKLTIWNPGRLPDSWNAGVLKAPHHSRPRNRCIADVFFKAGYIESWGRGIRVILESCKEAGLPEPIIEEYLDGVQVTFLKDTYSEEYLRTLDINERQVKAVLYVKEKKSIKSSEYQLLNDVGKSVATDELRDLIDKNILEKQGSTGRGTKFVLLVK